MKAPLLWIWHNFAIVLLGLWSVAVVGIILLGIGGILTSITWQGLLAFGFYGAILAFMSYREKTRKRG